MEGGAEGSLARAQHREASQLERGVARTWGRGGRGEESWTYSLSATKGFMKNVPVRIVSIASSGDTLRVSGKALKPDGSVLKKVENDIRPAQVAEIESNLGKGNFSVQGEKALINFSKVV